MILARRLLRLMGKPETLLSYVKDRPGHDRRYALKCEKIERELGWKPSISLEEGLRQTIDWYKANGDWMAGVRGGEYRTYYEKYYENRDSSLHAIAHSGVEISPLDLASPPVAGFLVDLSVLLCSSPLVTNSWEARFLGENRNVASWRLRTPPQGLS